MFGEPIAPWHYWFAWHPIRTWDGRWVWLRKVQRRLIQRHQYIDHEGDDQWWQYHRESSYVPNTPANAASGRNHAQQPTQD